MTDHSPTSVEDWMRCPTFWWWRHERHWIPKSIGSNDLAAWFGRAIDRGVKARYAGQPDGTQHALDELTEAVEEARAWGRDDPPDLSEMRTRIRQTLAVYRPEPWTIVAIDQRIGRAILDLVIREGGGELAVVDIKTKQKKPRDPYWTRQLHEWRKSWQMADYVQRAGASNAYIHAIVAEPFEVVTHPITPDPGWAQDAGWISKLMDASEVDRYRWRNRSRCHDWFGGDCPYLRACWDYEGDETRFPVDYVQRGRVADTREGDVTQESRLSLGGSSTEPTLERPQRDANIGERPPR